MKREQNLADSLMQEWSRKDYRRIDPDNWVAKNIAKAKRFVLDPGMSAFLADLSYTTLNACKTVAKRQHLIDSTRRLARLPHATCFIEYDKQAHRKRVKEFYHPDIVAERDSVPDRSGWLLMQHPTLETAFMALHVTSHSWDETDKRQALPNAGQFAYAWTCDDSIPPWPRDPFYHQNQTARITTGDPDIACSPSGILTGVLEYHTESFSIIRAPYISKAADDLFKERRRWHFNPLGELAHDSRYLWSLLATLNSLPANITSVKADRGYIGRGRYGAFLSHSVITLTVPVTRYKQVAQRAIAIARRRAHQVRGHFRVDRHHPGEKIWIREHVRGDASLGFVSHDYNVTHEVDVPT